MPRCLRGASTDAILLLENRRFVTRIGEARRGRQTGNAGPDDDGALTRRHPVSP